ncbi:thyroid adenoma-associated protein homolog isoform X3 [Gallus gallus]|uniref:thyroid adenoma-associated protein homolog isoform X3 n=1 Tax=Gallus gallus TaxID=9031 RepID=UPI000739C07B|nr:thyroid adenoma-associated protein homolog isoform X3 [Gallus gallus]|eukprot:XP_015130956.1 thyroid adenoma-associated protein homolog isoform X2 [Gallus gallus]
MGAEREARACAAFYGDAGRCGPGRAALRCVRCLRQFAGSTAKRCRDEHLEEALQLAQALGKELQALGEAEVRPLLRCVLAFQLEAAGSSSAFQKLEQIVTQLAVGQEAVLVQEVGTLLAGLAPHGEVLSPEDLQAVCMFIEESRLGRHHWQQNMAPLLQRLAHTLSYVLQGQPAPSGTWGCLAVKACLQLFQVMPKDVAPLVWSAAAKNEALQRILGLLLEAVAGKALSKDVRLLAGTALSMLLNTAPQPESGARAALTLFQLMDRAGAEELRVGELAVEAHSIPELDGLERLALSRGLLTCCRADILCCRLEGSTCQACLLLDVLFPIVCTLSKEQKDCHYHCFQVLVLWLRRVQENLPELWHLRGGRLLAEDAKLLQKLTQLVWDNAEAPVEGVSEFIQSSFRVLLEIYHLECQHFEDQERPLYQQMLQRAVSMPWQIKARYVPLCALVPYVGSQQVLDACPMLPQHLLSCLATNHLCPTATELYRALVRQQCSQGQGDVQAELWAQHWLPLLSRALRSPLPILHSNAANHLLPWTLRQLPAAGTLLAAQFSGADTAALRAWVSLLRVQRSTAGVTLLRAEEAARLQACLRAREEGVRLAALGLLCGGPGHSLAGTEERLLREFLPLNLNCHTSAFRQLLQAALRKVLGRLRDGALARLRGKDPREPRGEGVGQPARAVDFVEWLLQLCISSLTPWANYQRKKTALLLLTAILETCTDTWSPERKKGQPPRTMATLLGHARQSGCWDFFSRPNLLALLGCLQDSTNEIRDTASELLVRYFPAAFPETLTPALLRLAQDALSSPRVQEAEAGAVLMKTVLHKSDSSTLKLLALEAKTAQTLTNRSLYFAQHLLRVLQAQLATAQQNLLQAAAAAPMHGVLAALRRCLLQVPEVITCMQTAESAQAWQELLSSLVDTARDITSLLLGALQSQQGPEAEQQVAAPSFADMGNAIGSLIMLGKGQREEEEDSVLLSEEHSLILTCCWVSVKEVGLLLGGLAELLLSSPGAKHLLQLTSLQTAATVFQEILLRCRHWGAVEGCSMGFTKFCAALLNHPNTELQAIPQTILDQGLEALSGPRSSSITRRAAGFPMLFLCIVSGENPAQARPLLTRCIQTLLALATMALPQDWDQTLDLPQVCALHVLQTLVRGAGLGAALLRHATPMVALALRGLSSPCWAMRNAAIQLFSALTTRLLGQKQSSTEGCLVEGLSLPAFLGQHPQLGAVLLAELEAAVPGGPHLRPALHAVLTLLAQLQPGPDDPSSPSTHFLEPLLELAGSPIYAVRAMAAKALIPVVPPPQRPALLLQLAQQLPAPGGVLSHNALHGRLLQMKALLAPNPGTARLPAEALHPVALQLEARSWLLSPAQRCPLVRAAFLQVLTLLPASLSPGFTQSIWDAVSAELGGLTLGREPGCAELQVGAAVLHQTMARFACSEAARLADSKRIHTVCSLLQHPHPDVRLAVLSWVTDGKRAECEELERALRLTLLNLQSVLQDRGNKEFLRLYLEALVHLCRDCPSWSQEASQKLQGSALACVETLLLVMEMERPGPELLSQALCAASLLLTVGFGDEDALLVQRWCMMLEACGRPVADEVLRLAAACSLQTAGTEVLRRCRGAACPWLIPMALRVINMSIHLLQDEDPDVRHEAAGFASLVQHGLGQPGGDGCIFVQGNVGLLSLLQLLLDEFGHHPETFGSLLQHLPQPNLRAIVEDLEADTPHSLYKEDEPNVFAEPAALAQQLLPFLVQLLEKAPSSALHWLQAAGPSVLQDLHYCQQQWSHESATRCWMKALGCAVLRAALAVLLVRAQLVAHALRLLGEEHGAVLGLDCGAQELEQELVLVQGLLAQHGLGSAPQQSPAPAEQGEAHGDG